jgi:hypothetical protein
VRRRFNSVSNLQFAKDLTQAPLERGNRDGKLVGDFLIGYAEI